MLFSYVHFNWQQTIKLLNDDNNIYKNYKFIYMCVYYIEYEYFRLILNYC